MDISGVTVKVIPTSGVLAIRKATARAARDISVDYVTFVSATLKTRRLLLLSQDLILAADPTYSFTVQMLIAVPVVGANTDTNASYVSTKKALASSVEKREFDNYLAAIPDIATSGLGGATVSGAFTFGAMVPYSLSVAPSMSPTATLTPTISAQKSEAPSSQESDKKKSGGLSTTIIIIIVVVIVVVLGVAGFAFYSMKKKDAPVAST